MSLRRPLSVPIILAIVMIALLGVLTVGWVLLNVFGALQAQQYSGLYWFLLTIGSLFMILLLAGTIMYLILSIKAINLTRRQSNFIDSVTHELKSPLTSMKLYLQTLSRHHVSPAEQADFYRSMLEDLDRLDRLINQMLAAGRVDADRPADTLEDVDLAELLPQCAAAVCQSYRVPADTVRCDVSPCVIHAQRTDLDVIFRNLIDNAVKYAGTPPKVEVSLPPVKNKVATVHVADNGRGIPFAYRRKIFGRFVRLGSELERDKPGTGLGLFIVRTLVGRLRGRVRVRDRKAVHGTLFEVQLPLTK
jgi:two-component system, OmpR family, phosphate regulon sensor histidine kinase PhoR